MNAQPEKKKGLGSFSGLFWLVVMFEFFERGSYYGMMSFISVYFVDILNFPKENVGVIKGVIQPLLYFLPIISGALADRFGYRKVLMVAFAFLGGGYFLTSQVTTYGAVFAALVIMGFGAGLFKPLITGTIAKITDESNSTQGFGIYYWSINLGAFLFPLVLVPFLKAINPTYVIIASGICTAAMLIPTIFFFKDPSKMEKIEKREQTSMIQTLANAFEIIYSPVVLIYYQMKKSSFRRILFGLVLIVLLGYAVTKYVNRSAASAKFSKIGIIKDNTTLLFEVNRDMLRESSYDIRLEAGDSARIALTLYKPSYLSDYSSELINELSKYPGFENVTDENLQEWINLSDGKVILEFTCGKPNTEDFTIDKISDVHYHVILNNYDNYPQFKDNLLDRLHQASILAGITLKDCDDLHEASQGRSFFLLFVLSIVILALGITAYSTGSSEKKSDKTAKTPLPFAVVLLIGLGIWLLPGLAFIGRIIASVIYITVTSLFIIDKTSHEKFQDHAKFLLMIFLYSGFWILYFQMFDSVLWYVKAYVDASSLNSAINSFLGIFGIHINWFFDVEHVTVINAGTIILLQLLVSMIVRKTKALPTMMAGIALGTIGMAILAINTNIWVFMAGITIFSIGEMTAHPKFYSYIGLIAPKDRKAMYMGYVFLYGVFGSSIGAIIGAKLYVHFVDGLNQPRTLWLVFSCIGLFTIVALALYNKFLKPHSETNAA
jgi:dipeptide/tripeptide permease